MTGWDDWTDTTGQLLLMHRRRTHVSLFAWKSWRGTLEKTSVLPIKDSFRLQTSPIWDVLYIFLCHSLTDIRSECISWSKLNIIFCTSLCWELNRVHVPTNTHTFMETLLYKHTHSHTDTHIAALLCSQVPAKGILSHLYLE